MRRWFRGFFRLLFALAAGLALLAVWLHARYGGGRPYPDRSAPPRSPESALEVAVTSPEPIGNLAVDGAGRIFYTLHPESRPEGAKLWVSVDGRSRPFPEAAAQQALFETPLGLAIDDRGRLWTIDHGYHGFGAPRLLAFDLATGTVVRDFRLTPSSAPRGSFLQDLAIDPKTGTIFLADVSFFARRPAIVVIDPETGAARRVLEGHPSMVAQDWIVRTPAGEMKFFGGVVRLKVGVDGIAASPDGSFLAYAAMTHDTLYRIPIPSLLDPSLSPGELAARIVAVGAKPLSDGLAVDGAGGVLVTDVEHGAIVRVAPDGASETLVRTPRVRWADDLAIGPDGSIYLADSDLPDQMLRSRRHIREHAPYFIFRLRPPDAPRSTEAAASPL